MDSLAKALKMKRGKSPEIIPRMVRNNKPKYKKLKDRANPHSRIIASPS
eukprot:CAMPEP_0205831754 /NCGR_PEP_ID=MMETSP0206-20130828/45030_1 /ASSEMBLY_ACC=CAM_ASM_000279 /TAXON_ID=36767 /ORGANISM="Euplotes focardii, Strain TN1" /LENGTH=48 /DNA_ID= /DNA_START= /DNA_END= /DNA_ORIENTATION=